jgi:hypothetical protein
MGMTADWHEVYLQERRRPAYVIENGKSIVKHNGDAPPRRDVTPPRVDRKRAA